MSVWNVLKSIKAKQLFGFFRFFIRHPLFAVATFFATVSTYKIAEEEFPKIHGKLNKANAFRHALWNYLIAKSCSRYSKNEKKIIRWTKDVVDWHEELFINKPLPREMDLHNNEIGRDLFVSSNDLEVPELRSQLLELLKSSRKVTSLKEITKAKGDLVYLEE